MGKAIFDGGERWGPFSRWWEGGSWGRGLCHLFKIFCLDVSYLDGVCVRFVLVAQGCDFGDGIFLCYLFEETRPVGACFPVGDYEEVVDGLYVVAVQVPLVPPLVELVVRCGNVYAEFVEGSDAV